jgi:hypothetical protein
MRRINRVVHVACVIGINAYGVCCVTTGIDLIDGLGVDENTLLKWNRFNGGLGRRREYVIKMEHKN